MADINGTAANDAIQPFGSSLLLTLAASTAEGQWPIINVVVNGQTLVSGLAVTASNAAGATKTVDVPIHDGMAITSFSVQYTNDTQTSWASADRNLFIKSITLDGTPVDASWGTYTRSADNSTVAGQFDMIWGGNLNFSGPTGGASSPHTGGTLSVDACAGIDTVYFAGPMSAFSVSHTSTGYTVSGNGQTANIVNAERLHFADTSLAVDMTGHAGTAAKLIAALFGTAYVSNHDFVGLGLKMLDAGTTEGAAASMAIGTPLFAQLAGSTSNTDFVKLVYHNVMGSDISASDLNQYVGLLDSQATTKADLAVMAAEAAPNIAHLTGVMDAGLQFTVF